MNRNDVLNFLATMSDDDYQTVLIASYEKRPRPLTVLNPIINKWKRKQTQLVKKTVEPSGSLRNTGAKGPCSALPSKEVASQGVILVPRDPLPFQKSAWQTGLVFRGDKIKEGGLLFLDTEMVSLKLKPGERNHKNAAATVSIVNEDKKLVLWAFVAIPPDSVCQYFPKLTGIKRDSLGIGVTLAFIHILLEKLKLCNTTIVGFGLNKDLEALNFSWPRRFDLHSFFKDNNNQPFKLTQLISFYFNRRGFQEGVHSSIIDARLTRDIYYKMMEIEKKGSWDRDCQELTKNRKRFQTGFLEVGDRCTCSKAKTTKATRTSLNQQPSTFAPSTGLPSCFHDDEPKLFMGRFDYNSGPALSQQNYDDDEDWN